jgi:hypothetical protein
MSSLLSAFASGLLFGLGLAVSGMINPGKVLAFLDIAGDWDPSLAFVMLGAFIVTAPGYAMAKRLQGPLCGDGFQLPAKTAIDHHLTIGTLLFGIGWGLVGYCPGPALASLGIGGGRTFLFVIAMLIGMAVFTAMDRMRQPIAAR